jgi:hypothetical protein
MTVWIYVDTRKQVGDKDHLKVVASEDAANAGSPSTIRRPWRSSIPSSAEPVLRQRRSSAGAIGRLQGSRNRNGSGMGTLVRRIIPLPKLSLQEGAAECQAGAVSNRSNPYRTGWPHGPTMSASKLRASRQDRSATRYTRDCGRLIRRPILSTHG